MSLNLTACLDSPKKAVFPELSDRKEKDYERNNHYPIKYPPIIASSSLENITLIHKDFYPKTSSESPDPSIYKPQQAHLLDSKLKLKLTNRINELSKLPSKWDGNKSQKILPGTTKYTKSLLDEIFSHLSHKISFVNKFEVFPTIKGGYQFEIRIGHKEIELEYSPCEKVFEILFVEIIGEKEIYQEEQINIKKSRNLFDKLINWLIAENV